MVYHGSSSDVSREFDAELVELVLKRDKAAGLDGITAEHLLYSHSLLLCVLAKLYNLMVKLSYVPQSFGKSYTVALLKSERSVYSKSATGDDFRGISISSVLSKVLEHCVLDRYRLVAYLQLATISLYLKSSLVVLMQFTR